MNQRRADTLVIGVGNADRGDDGAGLCVVGQLRGRLPLSVELLTHSGEAAGLLALMAGRQTAVIIDAARGGGDAGAIYRFDVAAEQLPASLGGWSSHGFGVAAAVALGRALGELPPVCIVYAIEGSEYSAGAGISRAVQAAVAKVAGHIVEKIGDGAEGSGFR